MRPRALIWLIAAISVGVAARNRLDAVEVRGRSMSPTLLPGDRLLVVRAWPRKGDIVLAPDPREPARELIKRVRSLEADAALLRGDNVSASTGARVPLETVQWRALLVYWPLSRVRTLAPPSRSFAGRT
jgi:signal peptidase I